MGFFYFINSDSMNDIGLTIIKACKEHWQPSDKIATHVMAYERMKAEDAACTLVEHLVNREDLNLDEPNWNEDGFFDKICYEEAHQAWQQRECLLLSENGKTLHQYDKVNKGYFKDEDSQNSYFLKGLTVAEALEQGCKLNPKHPLVQPIVGIEGLSHWVAEVPEDDEPMSFEEWGKDLGKHQGYRKFKD